jgi:8-oxo-dGTP pyrophosphatase MutT (NUDIX family)
MQGLHREILEELGGIISDAKVRPIEKFTSENKNFVYHTFHIVVDDEFIPALNGEHDGYCWVPLEKYPKPLHPGVWRTFKFDTVINKIKTLEKLV